MDLSFEEALVLSENGSLSKRIFKSQCVDCGNTFESSIRNLSRRVYNRTVSLCKKCASNRVVNSQEWKKKNASAQLVAQNKPETKEKIRAAVKSFWANNPETKKRVGEKCRQRYETDANYRSAVQRSKYKGKANTRFGKINFDSLLELQFLKNCEYNQNVKSLIRWNMPGICLNDGHRYYPDFIVNEQTIVELKGSWFFVVKPEEIKKKAEACKIAFPQYRYSILTEKDIPYTRKNMKNVVREYECLTPTFFRSEVEKEYNETKKEVLSNL